MLLKNIEASIHGDNLGEKFLLVIPFLKTYTDYFNNFEKVATLIRDARKEDKKFAEWLSRIEKQCRLENKLDLKSYLIQPVQRIPRYNLLLKELLKHTDTSHKDYNNIKKALEGTVSIADFLNKKMKEIKSDQMKERLVSSILFDFYCEREEFMKPHRRYVHEGVLEVIESSNRTITPYDINDNYHYVLMNDIIYVCEKIEEEGIAGCRQSIGGTPLPDAEHIVHRISLVGDIPWVRSFAWQPTLFQLICSEGNVLFRCKTVEEATEWISQFGYLTLLLDEHETSRKARCRLQPTILIKEAATVIQSLYRGRAIAHNSQIN
jgi:hypothetical protein